MKKTALIWRKSIYDEEENGIFRCNLCKCKLADMNTGEINGDVPAGTKDFLFCPDCGNLVAKIKEIEDDNIEGKSGHVKRGHWEGEF